MHGKSTDGGENCVKDFDRENGGPGNRDLRFQKYRVGEGCVDILQSRAGSVSGRNYLCWPRKKSATVPGPECAPMTGST